MGFGDSHNPASRRGRHSLGGYNDREWEVGRDERGYVGGTFFHGCIEHGLESEIGLGQMNALSGHPG